MKNSVFQTLILTAVMVIFILGLATPGFAFDKSRKGFILGFGLGPGYAKYTETKDSSGTEVRSFDEGKISLFSDFKIGYAPSEKLMVYWMSKGAWFGVDSTVIDEDKETVSILGGMGGLGVTYFFSQEVPSFYVSAGVGFSSWSLPFEGTDPWTGIGAAGSIGYEFSRNWMLEASVLYGKPKHDIDVYSYEVKNIAFGLTINVLGY